MWLIHDYENQNYEYYGSLASPHDPRNYIVATGWAVDNNPVQAKYFHTPEEAANSNWLESALAGQKVYVAHNATFEIHWNLKTYPETFLNWIKEGGRIWCTQYAEFILSNQLELYPSLEDTALKYGGTHKVDAVKILWEQGHKTADIDEALLMDYLADQEHGDVANTRRACFSQVKIAKERNIMPMMWARMDSLLFNAISTFNGLYVDLEVAKQNQDEQEKRIVEIQSKIFKLLPEYLPFEFSFTSPYHMSAFLFGGSIKYKAKVSYEPKKYEQIEVYEITSEDGAKHYVEPQDVFDISKHNVTVFKAGKNKGLPKVFKIDSDVEKLKWGELTYRFDPLIDLYSLPKLVQDQFLGKRAEFAGKRTLVCGTPVFSTGKEVLDLLTTHKVEVAGVLKELAALLKDTGTYYLTVDEKTGKTSGMLQFVEPTDMYECVQYTREDGTTYELPFGDFISIKLHEKDKPVKAERNTDGSYKVRKRVKGGIIHHQLNNCATVTGRLSGSKPNMQNVPRDGTSKVKEMFVSRFGKQGRIVEVDYSALEVVALAAISGDKNLLQALIDGIDMHCYRLAGALKEDYDTVYEQCHNKEHPEHKAYKQMRTDIKPRAFANQYGASAMGIALSTGCSIEEAELFKQTEIELFPESSLYAELFVRPMVEETGKVAPVEREMDETGTWKVYRRGYFEAKGGTRYSFRQYPKRIEGRIYYDYKPTQIANYWCQGEASFIVQAACGRVIRELIKRNFADGKVLPINTVHDAIYLDCATEDLAKGYGTLVKEIMESTPKWLCEQIPAYKDWRYDVTPFPAAAEMGVSMMNKVDI